VEESEIDISKDHQFPDISRFLTKNSYSGNNEYHAEGKWRKVRFHRYAHEGTYFMYRGKVAGSSGRTSRVSTQRLMSLEMTG
jgi:hypothetical protein